MGIEPVYYLILTGVFGLLIGSFLNVVIYRLPIMLHREWQEEQQASTLNLPFNLLSPRSHCPQCQKPVPIWANIPLLGYFIVKRKCVSCNQVISARYPLVELSTAVISVFIVWHFGLNIQGISALVLSWGLITLTAIDLDQQLLPDIITLPLLWLGLLLSIFNTHTNPKNAIIGGVTGYLFLWTVATLFKIIRKQEGMGGGDFKLLAVLGAWLGWQSLPAIVLIASLSGLILNMGLLLSKPYAHFKNLCIPFGPYLALGGWIMLLWGPDIMRLYWEAIL